MVQAVSAPHPGVSLGETPIIALRHCISAR